MTDKHKGLRDDLERSEMHFTGENVVIRARLVRDLLADHDALEADNKRLREALRWTAATLQDATASLDMVFEEDQITLEGETKTVAQILDAADVALAALTQGEQNG